MTKNILCYGDSNTWGSNASGEARFDCAERWPGVLQNALGNGYRVIEEGLPGRTTVWDDPIEGYKNGLTYLHPCLASHAPLDLVILMLGTNDLKARFSLTAYDIAQGAGVLVRVIQKSEAGVGGAAPLILLIAPSRIHPPDGSDAALMFSGGAQKSAALGEQFARMAAEYACGFLDAENLVSLDPVDGIHLTREDHHRLGETVAEKVRAMLESGS